MVEAAVQITEDSNVQNSYFRGTYSRVVFKLCGVSRTKQFVYSFFFTSSKIRQDRARFMYRSSSHIGT